MPHTRTLRQKHAHIHYTPNQRPLKQTHTTHTHNHTLPHQHLVDRMINLEEHVNCIFM